MMIKSEDKKGCSWQVFFFSMLLLVPYLDTGWIRDRLTYKTDRIYVYPIVFFMLAVIIIYILLNISKNNAKIKINQEYKWAYLFCIYATIEGTIRCFHKGNFDVFFVQLLWIIVPILYSIVIIETIKTLHVNVGKIIDCYLYLIAGYCIFSIIIYIKNFGYNFELSTRISGGTGSGGLLFSYTLILAYGLLILRKNYIPLVHSIIIMLVYLVFIFLSGSRIATVVAIITTVIFILKVSNRFIKIINLLMISFFMFLGLLIDYNELLIKIAPRLADVSSGIRGINAANSIKLFLSDSILDEFFGKGLGQFFPYQDWFINHTSILDITFSYEGMVFIVQPHNTFIHILLELGIIGLLLFVITICSLYKKIVINHSKNCMFQISFIVLSMIILNFFDSVFTINPGVASIWWIILFLLVNYKEDEVKQ